MEDRDKQILALTARYGLITASILLSVLFQGLTPKAVERVITRLLHEGLLRSQPLFARQHCYTLTPAGARLLGLDEKRFSRPMGLSALAKHLAMLQFCLGGSVWRRKMTAAEFGERFPTLASRGLNHDRYVLDDHSRLSVLVGDYGSDWRRLARKVRREAQRRRSLDAWKPFFRSRLFAVTLLTLSEEKARRLRKSLAKEDYAVDVVVVPEAAKLLLPGGD